MSARPWKADAFHEYINKSAIDSAQLAFRMLMLINGGAAVALLAFIAKLDAAHRGALADTLVWFASGVGFAVAGVALTYFTNFFLAGISGSMERRWEHPYLVDGPHTKLYRCLRTIFHIAAVVVGLLSLVTFVWGVLDVRDALHLVNGAAA